MLWHSSIRGKNILNLSLTSVTWFLLCPGWECGALSVLCVIYPVFRLCVMPSVPWMCVMCSLCPRCVMHSVLWLCVMRSMYWMWLMCSGTWICVMHSVFWLCVVHSVSWVWPPGSGMCGCGQTCVSLDKHVTDASSSPALRRVSRGRHAEHSRPSSCKQLNWLFCKIQIIFDFHCWLHYQFEKEEKVSKYSLKGRRQYWRANLYFLLHHFGRLVRRCLWSGPEPETFFNPGMNSGRKILALLNLPAAGLLNQPRLFVKSLLSALQLSAAEGRPQSKNRQSDF